jgi:hypothetical protein
MALLLLARLQAAQVHRLYCTKSRNPQRATATVELCFSLQNGGNGRSTIEAFYAEGIPAIERSFTTVIEK